jgi:hypothetical protein
MARVLTAAAPLGFALVVALTPLPGLARRAVRTAPARGPAATLRQEGMRAYRAGRFDEALTRFQEAAARDPDDPDALADVALALQRIGRTAEAVAVNRKVLRVASRAGGAKARRFSKVRLAAYSNLGRLGEVVAVPEVGACAALPVDKGTCKPLFACREARQNAGSGLATVWEVLRIAHTTEAAILDEDDYHEVPPLIPGLTDGEYESDLGHGPVDLSEQEGDAVLRYGTEEVGDECQRTYGDWSCESSGEVLAETLRCVGPSAPAAGAIDLPTLRKQPAADACFRNACDRAEKNPWPTAKAEIDQRAQRLAACHGGLGEIDDTTCVVVYVDACSGFIGTYCTTRFHRTVKPKADRHQSFEVTVPPS